MKTKKIFLSDNSIAIDLIRKYEYPYEILPHINDYIIKIGKKLGKEYKSYGENVWIHKSATVLDSVRIIGPCIIDEDACIRHCAYIRGSVIIGKNCVVGNSCELKNCILFDEVEMPHLSYAGDSILGYKSHMGAGSIISNTKSDRKEITIKYKNEMIETNMKKIGAFLGDYVEIGCNSVINPGSIIGPNSTIYPLTSFRGVIGANMIVKSMDNIVKKI